MYLRRLLVLVAALALPLGAARHAASAPAPAPPTAAADAASLTAGLKETVLPNGLKVLTREVHSAPVVSFNVWYKVGSRNERTGITGVSHLLEHMLFKGTKKYQLGEISRTLFANGADFNASTYYDWTSYYETVSADRLELAMQLESDRMVNSRIDKSDLDSEMTVVRSELEGGENNPEELLFRAVVAAVFEAHPYQWPVIGWRKDVEGVSRDEIYQYYKTHYGPNNATVVIVGDFDTNAALAMVKKYFGSIPRIPEPRKVYTQEDQQYGERRVNVERAGSLPMVQIAYRAPAPSDPDTYALDMLATVMGSGRASRLYQSLVQGRLATEADASNPSLRDPFLFTLGATAVKGKTADELEAALLKEVERVKNEPVTDAELARARNLIEAQFIFGKDSVSEQASQIGFWESTLSWKFLDTYLPRIRAVTAADLQRVAKKYLVATSRTVGQFRPTAPAEAAGPPPGEASARVEKPARGARPIPLPKPSPAPKTKRNVNRFQLGNGITVVVQENTANPSFAMTGSIPAGRLVEPQDHPGVAGLTAAMLSRGTKKHDALAFATALESVGASLGASAGFEVTQVSGRALSRDFDRLMDLLAELLREPTFPAEELERLKAQSLAGLEEERQDPDALARRGFNRAVYPEGHPLRQKTLDEAVASITSITREDLENYYRRQYGPDNLILVFSGDVKAAQVRQALEQRLGSWEKNSNAQPLPKADVPLAAKPVRVNLPVPDRSETAIMWGHAGGLKRNDQDYYATQVMNMILGGGGALNSRLGNTIRDEQGLAYGIGSGYNASGFAGPFVIGLGTNPTNAEKALAGVEAAVKKFVAEGVTQREVDEAVAYLTGSFPVSLETNEGLAGILWEMEFYKLGPDYIDQYSDRYRAVTLTQVNAAAKQHLHPDRAAVVISGTLPGQK